MYAAILLDILLVTNMYKDIINERCFIALKPLGALYLMELFGNKDFLLGVLSGIVASVLYYVFTTLLKSLKKALFEIKIFNVWKKSKIHHVFNNQPIDKMYEDAKNSNIIHVYTSLGVTFTGLESKFRKLLDKDNCDIKFIILRPGTKVAQDRKNEYNIPDFNEQLNSSIKVLKEHSNVKYALHDEILRTRLYIFDNVMYLGFMLERIHDENSLVFQIEKDSYLYKCFNKQFVELWLKYYKTTADENA